MWPSVTYEDENGIKRIYDLPSRLLRDRIILVHEEINDYSAASIIAQLLFLDSEDSKSEITMYINSPGGSVSAGFAIYDTMNNIKAPIKTVCMGIAASMGAFLLCSGSAGKRYCYPNSTVMIHQPLGGAQGQATDILISAERIKKLREQLYSIMAKNCQKDYEEIFKACERDNYLTPEEAKDFGLIDHIVDCTPKAWKDTVQTRKEEN